MLLPAITSNWPSLCCARIKPPSIPTVSGPSGGGSSIPVALTAVNKTALFLTQFVLQALRYIRDVLANGERIDGLIDRQHILQEFRRHPIAHERGPLGLQKQQLRADVLGK